MLRESSEIINLYTQSRFCVIRNAPAWLSGTASHSYLIEMRRSVSCTILRYQNHQLTKVQPVRTSIDGHEPTLISKTPADPNRNRIQGVGNHNLLTFLWFSGLQCGFWLVRGRHKVDTSSSGSLDFLPCRRHRDKQSSSLRQQFDISKSI